MINQLTKRNIMKNLISRTALCGIMLVSSGNSDTALESMEVPQPVAYNLCLTDWSIANDSHWINDMYAQRYPAPVWPEETIAVVVEVANKSLTPKAKPESGIQAADKACDFESFKAIIEAGQDYDELYEQAISFIKFHEGFCPSVYHCVAGYPTIGYGHVVQPGDNFPERISRDFADKLVRRDFDKSIKSALKYSPHLKGHQLIAVAHFCFAKGPGRYQNSNLRKIIERGDDPSSEFLKWCKYHTPEGELVTSQYCRRIREWEVRMYNAGVAEEHIPEIPEKPIEILDTIPNVYISEI